MKSEDDHLGVAYLSRFCMYVFPVHRRESTGDRHVLRGDRVRRVQPGDDDRAPGLGLLVREPASRGFHRAGTVCERGRGVLHLVRGCWRGWGGGGGCEWLNMVPGVEGAI